jgi:hypothetical protein
MPAFIITDPNTGRRIRVQGASQPSNEDIQGIFAQIDAGSAPASPAPAPAPAPAAPRSDRAKADTLGEFTTKPETVPESSPGLGVMAAEMGTSVAGGALGQTIGAAGGPAGMAVGGAIGSGIANIANQLMRMRADPNYKFKFGELMAEVGTGAIPGGPLLKGGARTLAWQGVKQAAGGVAAGNIQSVMDEGRLQTAKENLLSGALPAVAGAGAQKLLSGTPEAVAAATKAMRKPPQEVKTLQEAQKLGLKALPSEIKKGGVSTPGATSEASPEGFFRTQLESLGGATASKRQIQLENQQAINDAVKKQLGVKGDELSPAALKNVRVKQGEVYGEFASMAETARPQLAALDQQRKSIELLDPNYARSKGIVIADELQKFDAANAAKRAELETAVRSDPLELRKIRGEAQEAMDRYYASGGKDVNAQTKAFELRDQATKIEEAMEQAAANAGKPQLAKKLVNARRMIARTYAAEDALNPGNFNIDPDKLGQAALRGVPLDGNLATIANFRNAYPQSVREASKVAEPGVSHAATILAGGGTLLGTKDPVLAGAAAVAMPLAREAARGFLTSDVAQKRATDALLERTVGRKINVPTEVRLGESATRMTGQQAAKAASDETPDVIREDVEALQEDPQGMKAEFEKKYGKGSSAKYLFRKKAD